MYNFIRARTILSSDKSPETRNYIAPSKQSIHRFKVARQNNDVKTLIVFLYNIEEIEWKKIKRQETYGKSRNKNLQMCKVHIKTILIP